jgi:hypothetical protein
MTNRYKWRDISKASKIVLSVILSFIKAANHFHDLHATPAKTNFTQPVYIGGFIHHRKANVHFAKLFGLMMLIKLAIRNMRIVC